jgi:hypothetical protein
MSYRRRIYFTSEQKSEIWDRWQSGESMSSIGRGFDRNSSSIYPLLSRTGGIASRAPPHEDFPHSFGVYDAQYAPKGKWMSYDTAGNIVEFELSKRPDH